MNYLEKDAGLKEILLGVPGKLVGGLQYMTGMGTDTLKWGIPVAGTALLGGPLLAGYLLGKSKKKLREAGTPDPETLEREVLKRKYDDKIRELADRRGLFPKELDENQTI